MSRWESRRRVQQVGAALLVVIWTASHASALTVTDIGRRLGLPRTTTSWDVAVGELNGDGAPDLAISYHSRVVLYGNTTPGLEPIFSARGGDPHGCTIADVDGNSLGDVYCTRGAGRGTIEKANKLWMQTAPGVFRDRATAYRVRDRLGRGRRTTFVDINHDAFPDLFVGNATDRRDGRPSPNRTFLNTGGTTFNERDLGLTEEHGAPCVQAADQNGDGWDDLLVCGRLSLYRNLGGNGFRDVAGGLGIKTRGIVSGLLADLDGDGRMDLATVSEERLVVRAGIRGAALGRPVYVRPLRTGRSVAIGNLDARRGLDLLVVQSCDGSTNVPDVLLLDRKGRWGYRRIVFPQARRGCGDVAAAVDLNGDERDEFVVLNGYQLAHQGPVQVLTSRWP